MKICAIVLTYNEELHLERCITNLVKFCDKVLVLDSGSSDGTKEIALKYNCDFSIRNWDSYAIQFNYALGLVNESFDWILRVDADEFFTEELVHYILNLKSYHVPDSICGYSFNRRYYFNGTWIRYGVYPTRMLRLFRNGYGICELKNMDEHIILRKGKVKHVNLDFVDYNLNGLFWFLNKHNSYAFREASDFFLLKNGHEEINGANLKRVFRNQYYNLPLFFRSFGYFIVRYLFRGGFLNGRNGFIYFFYQSLYYRMTIDYIISEIEKDCKKNNKKYNESFKDLFNYSVVISSEE